MSGDTPDHMSDRIEFVDRVAEQAGLWNNLFENCYARCPPLDKLRPTRQVVVMVVSFAGYIATTYELRTLGHGDSMACLYQLIQTR